jgi:hypothetical protein
MLSPCKPLPLRLQTVILYLYPTSYAALYADFLIAARGAYGPALRFTNLRRLGAVFVKRLFDENAISIRQREFIGDLLNTLLGFYPYGLIFVVEDNTITTKTILLFLCKFRIRVKITKIN